MYFISCPVQPVLQPQSIRCEDHPERQLFTEQELLNFVNNTLDPSRVSDSDMVSILSYTFCFLALIFGFMAGRRR